MHRSPTATTRSIAALTHENLNAVLWMQTAAEYQAATVQVYTLARARLDQALKNPGEWTDAVRGTPCNDRAKLAVIVDVDETILDNSPMQARAVDMNLHHFDAEYWSSWESRGVAGAILGAVEFLQYADSKGVTVFYVTNRHDVAGLKKNLLARGFPLHGSDETILPAGCFPTGSSPNDKGGRRAHIATDHAVLLSMGDDLGDFTSISGLDVAGRRSVFERYRDHWGREWIVLPNPTYGSWESALDTPSDPDDVRLKKKREALRLPEK